MSSSQPVSYTHLDVYKRQHLDIAGTAWCDTPSFAFESKGATGAGVTSLYYMMKEAQNEG